MWPAQLLLLLLVASTTGLVPGATAQAVPSTSATVFGPVWVAGRGMVNITAPPNAPGSGSMRLSVALDGGVGVLGSVGAVHIIVPVDVSKPTGAWRVASPLHAVRSGTASDAGDEFGFAVAIHGLIAAVGAPLADSDGASDGTVFVFVPEEPARPDLQWGLSAVLRRPATPGQVVAYFGRALAVGAGPTVLVGAACTRTDGGESTRQAFVFVADDKAGRGNWTQAPALERATDTQNYDPGFSVALDGHIAVVGVCGSGTSDPTKCDGEADGYALVFVAERLSDPQAEWVAAEGQLQSPVAARSFGYSIAVSLVSSTGGARAVVGDNGMAGVAHVYEPEGDPRGVWARTASLQARQTSVHFGWSVAIDGQTVVVGAPGLRGSAYVFALIGAQWQQQLRITPPPGEANLPLGVSVAISEGVVAVTAPATNNSKPMGDHNRGTVLFTHERHLAVPLPLMKVLPKNMALRQYVAASDQLVVLSYLYGARHDPTQYGIIVMTPPTAEGKPWTDVLQWGDPNAAGVEFGTAIAVHSTPLGGSLVLIGTGANVVTHDTLHATFMLCKAPGPDGAWTQGPMWRGDVKEQGFGSSVALDCGPSRCTAVVGAPGTQRYTGCGVAYIYVSTTLPGEWQPVQSVNATTAGQACQGMDWFGTSVVLDVSRNVMLVGAASMTSGGAVTSGAVLVFARGQDATGQSRWVQVAPLPWSPEPHQKCGATLALHGNVALVGCPDANDQAGLVRVMAQAKPGGAWVQVTVLAPAPSGPGRHLGMSVALMAGAALAGSKHGSYVLVPLDQHNPVSPWGHVAVVRDGGGLGQGVVLMPSGTAVVVSPRPELTFAVAFSLPSLVSEVVLWQRQYVAGLSLAEMLLALACVREGVGHPGACPIVQLVPRSRYTLSSADLWDVGRGSATLQSTMWLKGVDAGWQDNAPVVALTQVNARGVSWGATGVALTSAAPVPHKAFAAGAPPQFDGGLVQLTPGPASPHTTFVLQRCTVRGGLARRGGGIYASSGIVRVHTSVFSRCSAQLGGAVYAEHGARLRVTNSSFGDCSAATLHGGAVAVAAAQLHLSESTFTNCSAASGGGALFLSVFSRSLTSHCSFTNCRARTGSGGAVLAMGTTQATLARVTFTGNMAQLCGGALFADAGTVDVEGCGLRRNTAVGGVGGGLAASAATVTLSGCVVEGNVAGQSGGGLAAQNGASLTVGASRVAGNWAGWSGGGVFGDASAVALTSSVIVGNVLRACAAAVVAQAAFTAYTCGGGGAFVSVPLLLPPASGPVVRLSASVVWRGNNASRGSALVLASTAAASGGSLSCSTNATACAAAPPNQALQVDVAAGSTSGGILWLNRRPVLRVSGFDVLLTRHHTIATTTARPRPGNATVHSMAVALAWPRGRSPPVTAVSQAALPPFHVQLNDAYGNMAKALPGDAVACSSESTLTGSVLAAFGANDAAARFTGLTVVAAPGTTVRLVFSLQPARGVAPLLLELAVLECPARYELAPSGLACQVCEPGYFSPSPNANKTACMPCPAAGVTCTGGAAVVEEHYWIRGLNYSRRHRMPYPPAGPMGVLALDPRAWPCYPADACEPDGSGGVQCAAGRHGALCGVCAAGFFMSGDDCARCPAVGVSWAASTVLFVALVCLNGFTIYRSATMWRREQEAGHSGPARPSRLIPQSAESHVTPLLRNAVVPSGGDNDAVAGGTREERDKSEEEEGGLELEPVLKIYLNWLQIMGLIGAFHVPWPASVQAMLGLAHWVSTITLPVSGFSDCILHLDFYDRFVVVMLSPAAAVVGLLVVPAVACLRSRSPQWLTYRTAVLASVYILYERVTAYSVGALTCSSPLYGGTRYLEEDMEVECDPGGEYGRYRAVAIVVIVVFCVALPLTSAVVLATHHARGRLHKPAVRAQWLFLTGEFRDSRCWWETAVAGRKLGLTLAGLAGHSGAGKQAYVGLLLLAISLCAQLAVNPYKDAAVGRLETASLMTTCLSMYIGMLFSLEGAITSAAGRTAAVVTLLVVNGAFSVVVGVTLARWLVAWCRGHRCCGHKRARADGNTHHGARIPPSLAVQLSPPSARGVASSAPAPAAIRARAAARPPPALLTATHVRSPASLRREAASREARRDQVVVTGGAAAAAVARPACADGESSMRGQPGVARRCAPVAARGMAGVHSAATAPLPVTGPAAMRHTTEV